jgi:hypothetical protein
MNRYTYTNLITGGVYVFEGTAEEYARWLAKPHRVRSLGHPERRITVAKLTESWPIYEDGEPWTIDYETMEAVFPVEGDDPTRVPLSAYLPGWEWTEGDGEEHPIRLDGDELISDAQFMVTVEDVTQELADEARSAARRDALVRNIEDVWTAIDGSAAESNAARGRIRAALGATP